MEAALFLTKTHTRDEKKIALLPVYILQFLAQIEMGSSVYNGNVLC